VPTSIPEAKIYHRMFFIRTNKGGSDDYNIAILHIIAYAMMVVDCSQIVYSGQVNP
jgi:hypothetical protein